MKVLFSDLIEYFQKLIKDENTPYAIAAMKALMRVSERDASTKTMQEFIGNIY